MLPSLRLLTRFLTDCHVIDWYARPYSKASYGESSLMLINRWNDISYATKHEDILEELEDEINYDYGSRLFTIPQRQPEERMVDPIDWRPLAGRIHWKIDEIPSPSMPGRVLGSSRLEKGHRNRRTIVTLSYLLLEPLLRSGFQKMTESERLVQQLIIATVLYHEMAVSLHPPMTEVLVNMREACILDDVLATRSFQCCLGT